MKQNNRRGHGCNLCNKIHHGGDRTWKTRCDDVGILSLTMVLSVLKSYSLSAYRAERLIILFGMKMLTRNSVARREGLLKVTNTQRDLKKLMS